MPTWNPCSGWHHRLLSLRPSSLPLLSLPLLSLPPLSLSPSSLSPSSLPPPSLLLSNLLPPPCRRHLRGANRRPSRHPNRQQSVWRPRRQSANAGCEWP